MTDLPNHSSSDQDRPDQPGQLPAAARPGATRPPRAFAQGTGVVLQVVGMTLFLLTCCVCSGMGIAETGVSPEQAMQNMQGYEVSDWGIREWTQRPARAGLMGMVVFMTAGGLAMAILGLGMQSDKPRAAGAALLATCLLTVILAVSGAGLWIGDASLITRIINVVLVLIVGVLAGFCMVAWREVRANPPSGELNTVPPDFDPKAYSYGTGQPLTEQQVEEMRQSLELQRQRLESIERHLRHHRPQDKDQADPS